MGFTITIYRPVCPLRAMRDDERREKRKKLIVGVVIAAIMILSTFGFVLNYATEQNKTERHNGIKYQLSGNYVVAQVNGQTLQFSHFPSQLTSLAADDVAPLLQSPVFYITSDPQDPYAKDIDTVDYYLTTILPKVKQTYPMVAFTNATGYSRPEVGCSNATASVPVVYLHYGNSTGLTRNGYCIDASARTPNDIYTLNDKMLFIILGADDGKTN